MSALLMGFGVGVAIPAYGSGLGVEVTEDGGVGSAWGDGGEVEDGVGGTGVGVYVEDGLGVALGNWEVVGTTVDRGWTIGVAVGVGDGVGEAQPMAKTISGISSRGNTKGTLLA